ncbi:MAG: hypothetical protein JSS49_17155 [Planctomycetes bacterium]|nr:hypothetical protein [Planctomycetota bacterium]
MKLEAHPILTKSARLANREPVEPRELFRFPQLADVPNSHRWLLSCTFVATCYDAEVICGAFFSKIIPEIAESIMTRRRTVFRTRAL